MLKMKILSIFVLLSISTVQSQTSAKKSIICSPKSLKQADRCGEELFFAGNHSRIYPTTESDAVKFCSESQILIRCVKDYTDTCATSEMRKNLANVMLYTARNTYKGACSSRLKRSRLISMGACANKVRSQTDKCVTQMLKEFGQAPALFDSSFRVPYGCCAFHKMQKCIRNFTNAKCKSSEVELFDSHIESLAGNTLNFICSDYGQDEAGEKCEKINKMKFDPSKSKIPSSLIRAFGQLLDLDNKKL